MNSQNRFRNDQCYCISYEHFSAKYKYQVIHPEIYESNILLLHSLIDDFPLFAMVISVEEDSPSKICRDVTSDSKKNSFDGYVSRQRFRVYLSNMTPDAKLNFDFETSSGELKKTLEPNTTYIIRDLSSSMRINLSVSLLKDEKPGGVVLRRFSRTSWKTVDYFFRWVEHNIKLPKEFTPIGELKGKPSVGKLSVGKLSEATLSEATLSEAPAPAASTDSNFFDIPKLNLTSLSSLSSLTSQTCPNVEKAADDKTPDKSPRTPRSNLSSPRTPRSNLNSPRSSNHNSPRSPRINIILKDLRSSPNRTMSNTFGLAGFHARRNRRNSTEGALKLGSKSLSGGSMQNMLRGSGSRRLSNLYSDIFGNKCTVSVSLDENLISERPDYKLDEYIEKWKKEIIDLIRVVDDEVVE